MSDYEYAIAVVDNKDGTYTARIGDETSPLRGTDVTPIQAVRQLCETLREWPISGANQWLTTKSGLTFARRFVPDFKAGKKGPES